MPVTSEQILEAIKSLSVMTLSTDQDGDLRYTIPAPLKEESLAKAFSALTKVIEAEHMLEITKLQARAVENMRSGNMGMGPFGGGGGVAN